MDLRSLRAQAQSYTGRGLGWHVGAADDEYHWIESARPTSNPEEVEQWKAPSGSRLALSTEASRLVAITFVTPDARARLQDRIGAEISTDAARMNDSTVFMRLDPKLLSSPIGGHISPGAILQGAWPAPVLIPQSLQLDWAQDPREAQRRLPIVPKSILDLLPRTAWGQDRSWMKLA